MGVGRGWERVESGRGECPSVCAYMFVVHCLSTLAPVVCFHGDVLLFSFQERALEYLTSCIDQVHEFNDILQLVIVELVYKVSVWVGVCACAVGEGGVHVPVLHITSCVMSSRSQ